MKRQDYRLILIVPSLLLLLPLVGQLTVEGWHWTWHDFAFAWFIFAVTTAFARFLMTRPVADLAYKSGVALAVLAGFLITWITMAVQIIGEDNPGNGLYLLTILAGFGGVFVARFRPRGLALVAFAMALVLLTIPAVAFAFWPGDFNPGYPKIQLLSAGFAALFATAGLLFLRAARQQAT